MTRREMTKRTITKRNSIGTKILNSCDTNRERKEKQNENKTPTL